MVIGVELLGFREQVPSPANDADNLFIDLPDSFLPSSTDWPLWAQLSNGRWVGCDLIVEATGVMPNSSMWKRDCAELELAEDGGILVNERMM